MTTAGSVSHAAAGGLPAAVPQARDYFSYSALRTYQQCPLRYHFRYVCGLPEATVSASLVFGGALHAALEHHYRALLEGRPPPDPETLLDRYQEGWRDRGPAAIRFAQDEDRASLDRLAARMLEAFAGSAWATPPGTILGVEEELRGPILPTGPELLGRLDLLCDTGDSYLIVDLKTSRARWTAAQVEEAAWQLLLYAELVSQTLPDRPVRLEFLVVTKTRQPSVERHLVPASDAQRTRARRVFERVARAIEAQHVYPAPAAQHCAACPYREPCRAWAG